MQARNNELNNNASKKQQNELQCKQETTKLTTMQARNNEMN